MSRGPEGAAKRPRGSEARWSRWIHRSRGDRKPDRMLRALGRAGSPSLPKGFVRPSANGRHGESSLPVSRLAVGGGRETKATRSARSADPT